MLFSDQARIGTESRLRPIRFGSQEPWRRQFKVLRDLTTESVERAMREYDALGRNAFLAKYGFGQSRSYFLVSDGKRYDSKAIVGAAHGFVGEGFSPLTPADFSGGAKTVQTP